MKVRGFLRPYLDKIYFIGCIIVSLSSKRDLVASSKLSLGSIYLFYSFS